MSEVVPLPSFGEVFFDARGQDRVLRVTWHEGTLVLSLWRGEMCTASFRMPMADVDRLIDTLDEGLAEVGDHDGEDADDPATGPFPGPQIPAAQAPGPEGYAPPPHEGYQDQVAYQEQGYRDHAAYQDQGYPDQGYQDQGYQDQAYQDPGYHEQGYQDQVAYQEQGYRDHAAYQDQAAHHDQAAYQGQAAYHDQPYQDHSAYQDSAPYQDYPDYPGTGQYARPPIPPPVSNDVLVARGAVTQDRLVAAPTPEPDVDPNDPLGLGAVRPYVPDPMYATGERLRPDKQQRSAQPQHGRPHEDDWGR
ncbi:hypothetical protein ACQP1K_10055 [Sphaerimonospora sp. CA-214678]|uniref:hypothetical protein n=1 Tax=Sphaerimonospora sp. CA-214678 TaxID=3240029 RepID=UPI003D921154